MYLTVKQQVKHLSKEDYTNLKELSHTAKNLTNEAIYNVRQYYFTEGGYLNYEKNYSLLKNSPDYKKLNSNMVQPVSNNGRLFIIDGRKLKSLNQWYNKQNASFWDKDNIPVYNNGNPKTYTFSGKRVHRGLYQPVDGKTLNADVNGALNIMRIHLGDG